MYRTPEFRWSEIHLRLLADLLTAIETDISAWKRFLTALRSSQSRTTSKNVERL